MSSARHILVVNGIKVRHPVFILGAPHSGTDLLARAIKRISGFHLTMGRPSVARVAYAFARRPSIAARREAGAARVIRDAFAEIWQITQEGCQECSPSCRFAGSVAAAGPCVSVTEVTRFADATPDLLYSAEVLVDAFPDARLIQVIRDGRDVIADMLADDRCLAWFKPSLVGDDVEMPNAFFGLDHAGQRDKWERLSPAGKCALRWRGAILLSALLRKRLSGDQLLTIRYEDLLRDPVSTAATISAFIEHRLPAPTLTGGPGGKVGARERLSGSQHRTVMRIAGNELHRLGYLK